MKIVILGGGPAGLYSGLLIKKAHPSYDITILERNPADITYGWGVVFSDRTLGSFQRADYKTYEQITSQFVIWDAIDICYRGETIRCGGHVIASIARKRLLTILQKRCLELGITLFFGQELSDLTEVGEYDLLIAADGLNSLVRKTYAEHFRPEITPGKARYIWLGAEKVLDAFTFLFRENEHGFFQVHAYPFSGTTSTFIIECEEATWLRADLEHADEASSLAYCERLLAEDLQGARLHSNNSKWVQFPTLTTASWHYQRIVLLGDAAHTAHFSIGSGTKLAMEDAVALAEALERHADLQTALAAYELERKPVVETFQRAAQESQRYFETVSRYSVLDPLPFAFQLLTRSGRITYDDLRLRDSSFGDSIDRWWTRRTWTHDDRGQLMPYIAPPPLFAQLPLRTTTLPNRVVITAGIQSSAPNGIPDQRESIAAGIESGAGLLLTDFTATTPDGRITPHTPGLYTSEQLTAWKEIVATVHTYSSASIALQLGHAGRRGSTRSRTQGLDRPLQRDNWPLLSASPHPYTPQSQVPRQIEKADMTRICEDFVCAAQRGKEAGFDLLHLNFAHGYLLASFLSPLTNHRQDDYGGSLLQRLRFPLEVFTAVRAVWPQEKPLIVALTADDCAKGGMIVDDAICVAKALKEQGCDMIEVLAGHTTLASEPTYRRGFLTALSDRIRNQAGIATLVGGYLTTSNEINTILAAGRADLCRKEYYGAS